MAGMSDETLEAVVELQRVELNRLLREHERLNARLDKLLELQEREQVLRQQMQAALDRLAGQPALAPPDAAPRLAARLAASEHRLRTLVGAAAELVRVVERRRTGGRVRIRAAAE